MKKKKKKASRRWLETSRVVTPQQKSVLEVALLRLASPPYRRGLTRTTSLSKEVATNRERERERSEERKRDEICVG